LINSNDALKTDLEKRDVGWVSGADEVLRSNKQRIAGGQEGFSEVTVEDPVVFFAGVGGRRPVLTDDWGSRF
jgi:hypothetical protein